MGAAAIVGTAVQLGMAGMSFAQATKQKKVQAEADAAAATAMIEQENLLQTNFAEQVQVPLEGYELAAQTNAAIQQQNTTALVESGDRALIGGVGRTMEAGAAASEQNRINMQKELYDRDSLIAAEDDRIRNERRDVELNKLSGAQRASAEAEVRRENAMMQGVQAVGGAAGTAWGGMDLYAGGGLGGNSKNSTNPNGNIIYPEYETTTIYNDAPVTTNQGGLWNEVPGGGNSGYNYTWDQF